MRRLPPYPRAARRGCRCRIRDDHRDLGRTNRQRRDDGRLWPQQRRSSPWRRAARIRAPSRRTDPRIAGAGAKADSSASRLRRRRVHSMRPPACSLVPVAVSGGLVFKQLAGGGAHTCGLTSDGTAYCWGRNASGQLGDDTTTLRTAPVPVVTSLKFAASMREATTLARSRAPVSRIAGDSTIAGSSVTVPRRTGPLPWLSQAAMIFESIASGGFEAAFGHGHTCAVLPTDCLLLGRQRARPTRHWQRRARIGGPDAAPDSDGDLGFLQRDHRRSWSAHLRIDELRGCVLLGREHLVHWGTGRRSTVPCLCRCLAG